MKTLGYYDGKIGEIEEMTVPMLDRACFFGDGVYEATYVRNYNIHCLQEHLDRLYRSAALLSIEIPYTKEALAHLLQEMVNKLDAGNLFLYWQVSRGAAPRAHVFPEEGTGKLWMMIREDDLEDCYEPMKLITLEDTRFLHCNIKTLNLLPNVMASQQAKMAGCDEVVLHRGERVTECAHSNVHILKDGVFRTHPTDCYILSGIARGNLIRYCKELDIAVDETPFTVGDLFTADEVIVSSSGTYCTPACEIDGKAVGGKAPALLKKLQDMAMADFYATT